MCMSLIQIDSNSQKWNGQCDNRMMITSQHKKINKYDLCSSSSFLLMTLVEIEEPEGCNQWLAPSCKFEGLSALYQWKPITCQKE